MAFDEQTLLTNKQPRKQPQYIEEATKIIQPKSKQKANASTSGARIQTGKKSEHDVMPLGKLNFILLGVSLVLIVVGFVMMSGSSNTGDVFNSSIFDSSRIVMAPMLVFIGFLLVAVSIVVRIPQKKNNLDAE